MRFIFASPPPLSFREASSHALVAWRGNSESGAPLPPPSLLFFMGIKFQGVGGSERGGDGDKQGRTNQPKERKRRTGIPVSKVFLSPQIFFSFKLLCLKKCNTYRLYVNVHDIINPLDLLNPDPGFQSWRRHDLSLSCSASQREPW